MTEQAANTSCDSPAAQLPTCTGLQRHTACAASVTYVASASTPCRFHGLHLGDGLPWHKQHLQYVGWLSMIWNAR